MAGIQAKGAGVTPRIEKRTPPPRCHPGDDRLRYARNIFLPEIGEEGQKRLLKAKVLVIGGGGLGSPLLLYLAAAGVGTLGMVDDDVVALSNLQRQILYASHDIGRLKGKSAARALRALNPDVVYRHHPCRLEEDNVDALIADYDVIADGCDNFRTRFAVNAACLRREKPLVSAAVIGFSGELYTFKPYLGAPHPCYRCLYPEAPPMGLALKCSQSGVLGSVAGVIGSWQATEVIKEVLGIGESLSGTMMVVDALTNSVDKIKVKRNPACSCCGGH